MPPGIKGADFKTLQDMIAKGIQDAETGATKLEADIRASDDEGDLQRHKELQRRKRDEDMAAKQREKDAAKEKRRREDELRRKKLQEEMDREEDEERRQREGNEAIEAQCMRQFRAVVRIQALIRGRRSRAGNHILSPVVVAMRHSQPWS